MRRICRVVFNDEPYLANCGDLLLDWSLRLDDGARFQLATQRLASAPFDVSIRQDDKTGRLTAAVWMTAGGTLRTIADKVTLSDLSMAVIAAQPAPSAL